MYITAQWRNKFREGGGASVVGHFDFINQFLKIQINRLRSLPRPHLPTPNVGVPVHCTACTIHCYVAGMSIRVLSKQNARTVFIYVYYITKMRITERIKLTLNP